MNPHLIPHPEPGVKQGQAIPGTHAKPAGSKGGARCPVDKFSPIKFWREPAPGGGWYHYRPLQGGLTGRTGPHYY